MERLSGIGREDAVGRRLSRTVSRRPGGAVRTHARARCASIISISSRSRRRTGEATLNIAIAPLVSREMEQIGRLVIFDDITDRAELERRLVQADKLSSIGLLAAGVAHEVNTPLAVISTYAQMLAQAGGGRRAEIAHAGEDRAADVPRQRDREFAAELLAHVRPRN